MDKKKNPLPGSIKILIAVVVFAVVGLLVMQVAHAQTTWRNDFSIDGLQIANITNGQGSAAGVLCNLQANTCNAYISLNASCEDGVTTPMMINSPLGTFPVIATCVTIGGSQFSIIAEFDSAVSAFQSGGEIGFAIPLKNGQFQVVRFSTAGATAAINAARQMPLTTPARGGSTKLKADEIL